MNLLPYRLRITSRYVRFPVPEPDPVPEDVQTIRLIAFFVAPDGRRGRVVRAVSHTMLGEGLRAGLDVMRCEQKRIEALIAEATGQPVSCVAARLPHGWSSLRGPDSLVADLWPSRLEARADDRTGH